MQKLKVTLVAGLALVALSMFVADTSQAQFGRRVVGVGARVVGRTVAPVRAVAPVRRVATAPIRAVGPAVRVATAPVRVAAAPVRLAAPVRVVAPYRPVVGVGVAYPTPFPTYHPYGPVVHAGYGSVGVVYSY